ncbi:MAG: VCBS repeat-containing protein [Gemmatimonadetes bacterium]|nr:VCBS repeat-containing protein [Gemmatimonadota bacterium]
MHSPPRHRLRAAIPFLVAASLVALAACPERKTASVEELYSTRMLGVSYLQRNQLAEAETQFTKLTELAPEDPLGFANLGYTYLQAGRFAEAEKQLDQARKLDPSSADIGLALARVYALTNRPTESRALLEKLRGEASGNTHVLYALALLDSAATDPAATARYRDRLRDVLAAAPGNLVARLGLVDAFVRASQSDSAVHHLEEVRRTPPEPSREALAQIDSTIQLLRAGNLPASRQSFDRLMQTMVVTSPYQASMEEVRWTEAAIPGRPTLTFVPKSFVNSHGVRDKATIDVAKFVDASLDAGLSTGARPTTPTPANVPITVAAGDVDGDGVDDLFISAWAPDQKQPALHLYRVRAGFFREAPQTAGIVLPSGASFATFADFDNDGWLDLFAIGGDGRGYLFRNTGNGTFTDVSSKAGIGDVHGARRGVFVDLDHDGDLDLLVVGPNGRTVYRNNLDGTFTESSAAYGIASTEPSSDVAFGDFDGDGRIDLYIAGIRGKGTSALLRNGGAQRFTDATQTSGLATAGGASVVAAADYDNDGAVDLFRADAGPMFWRNNGSGTFTIDSRNGAVTTALRGLDITAATFVDYDNDGWLDLVVAANSTGGKPALFLFRNDGTGKFLDRSNVLPAQLRPLGAAAMAVSDIDDDGDEDLTTIDASGTPHLLRNELGNSNLALNVELKALGAGSGKNNTFGIGSRMELRAGELFQTRIATARRTHFGLGSHLKSDVLRIEWPNGVPQTVFLPGNDKSVVEQELLKGSCAFAYTWDGKRFRFVTDAMWRSALGMPLGLMGSGTAFAPAGASQEYLRIPGDALAPKDGRYLLQLTEELWETAYADEVKLVAVDHPDSVDVFVDETFVPPGPVKLRLFHVGARELPRSAVDERGMDVLPALRASDDVYVSNFVPTRYQGVVEPHDLVMDLGPNAGGPDSRLFLRGWIYPTDASINVALAQQKAIAAAPPSLEVRDARGRWVTVVPSLGFPSGKDKTMVIDLAGKFPTADHHVRIRTSMQIYWDQAFVARAPIAGESKLTTLAPISVDLHARGFSRMYRKGGRYGPYWFDYDSVTKQSPWRPITGRFTRYGDVLPLLRAPDDQYIVMAPGDEATIQFDAASANAVPRGWKRDFLLYTDGWIKDSDLNTAFGTTVEPLPFHAIRSYPYAAGEAYPTDSAHQRYLEGYNTRVVPRSTARR